MAHHELIGEVVVFVDEQIQRIVGLLYGVQQGLKRGDGISGVDPNGSGQGRSVVIREGTDPNIQIVIKIALDFFTIALCCGCWVLGL